MKALVLINEKSGTVLSTGAENIEETIVRELRERSVTDPVIVTGDWRALVEAAQSTTFDVAICAGGDGTQAAVAQALLGKDAALLPLPCGTVNLLCRDLGLSLDIEEALKAGLDGAPRRIDAGLAGKRVFLNNIVFGAYAELAEAREDLRDAESFDDLNFALVSAANALFHADPVEFDVHIGKRKVSLETSTLIVSNNAITNVEKLIPRRDRLDDGALAVYLVSSQNGEEFTSVLGAFARGAIEDDERIDMRHCRACRVASPSAKFSYTVDGDALERSEPLHVKCLPGALRVLSP